MGWRSCGAGGGPCGAERAANRAPASVLGSSPFATLLIAAFVELSGWSEAVDLIAAFALILVFAAAIAGYCWHGWRRDTDNQFRDPMRGLHGFMWALIVAEIGAFAVLLAGFVDAQIL